MSRPARKPTLSTRISLSMPRRLTRTDNVCLLWICLFQELLLYTSIPLIRNVSKRIILRGLRRLIAVDTFRRVHNIGFLVERLIYSHSLNQNKIVFA